MGQERILDSARKVLMRNVIENSVRFFLNKQAAFMGRVHFVTNVDQEDPLGPITIQVIADDVEKLIKWLTAKEEYTK